MYTRWVSKMYPLFVRKTGLANLCNQFVKLQFHNMFFWNMAIPKNPISQFVKNSQNCESQHWRESIITCQQFLYHKQAMTELKKTWFYHFDGWKVNWTEQHIYSFSQIPWFSGIVCIVNYKWILEIKLTLRHTMELWYFKSILWFLFFGFSNIVYIFLIHPVHERRFCSTTPI